MSRNTKQMVFVACTGIVFIGFVKPVFAVPPPDFLFSLGTSILHAFVVVFAFLLSVGGALLRVMRHWLIRLRHRRIVIASVVLGCGMVALVVGFGYAWYQRRVAYRAWELHQQLMQPNTDVVQGFAGETAVETVLATSTIGSATNSFFEIHHDLPLEIPISELLAQSAFLEREYILDAREDEEYAVGHYPGSIHIRAADVFDDYWKTLPTDRIVYVICWSGMRGKQIAEFLRSKHIVARYVSGGASEWVKHNGVWEGEISFTNAHPEERYRKVFSTKEAQRLLDSDVLFVDVRSEDRFTRQHIPGSIGISILQTPTRTIGDVLAVVPAHSRVVTICDNFISCFDAKITGLRLENVGHEFLGRFATPWDYDLLR